MLSTPWTRRAGLTGRVKVCQRARGVGANPWAVAGPVHRPRVTPVLVCVAVCVG